MRPVLRSTIYPLLAISALVFSACSQDSVKMPAGRCNVNSDCSQGYRCDNTYCKDIYFPEETIKRK